MAVAKAPLIDGSVKSGFEPVREAFIENFTRRGELGAACCIYQHGAKVVDPWGGVRHRSSGEPWRADTTVVVHSTTKGLSAMVLALAQSRGLLDYDERVCTYWPEFAQAGKEAITVRQLLAHQAGLFAFGEKVDREVVADLDRLAGIMARQRPAWEPGERQAYHAISLGFYESELVRRIDPRRRSLGRFFDEEIAKPLDLDFYIGIPESIPDTRLAPLEPPSLWKRLTSLPLPITLAAMNKRSVLYRSLIANPGTAAISLWTAHRERLLRTLSQRRTRAQNVRRIANIGTADDVAVSEAGEAERSARSYERSASRRRRYSPSSISPRARRSASRSSAVLRSPAELSESVW
jgi:CubicO group peptidase (beta-lactamase class C family)